MTDRNPQPPLQTEKVEIVPMIRYACVLLALIVVNNIFRLTPNLPQAVWYAAVIFMSGIVFLGGPKAKGNVCFSMWIFWLLMWASIIYNYSEISPIFMAPFRTMAFLLVLGVAAPWVVSSGLNEERMIVFDTLCKFMLFMAVLSFFGRILHFLPTDKKGLYLGCTYHSMQLAPVAGIGVLFSLYKSHIVSGKAKKNFYHFTFFCSSCVILFASSRTAFASGLIAVLAFFDVGTSGRVNNAVKSFIILCLLGFVIHLAFPNALSGILHKSREVRGRHTEITLQSVTYSRQALWNARIEEIKESPLWGTGAHTIRHGLGRMLKDGKIEPGNAWLYIFSSMGFLAFLTFAFMFLTGLRRARYYARSDMRARLIFAALVFFGLYMNGEAHVTAIGDFTCFYYWLLLALAMFYDFPEPEKAKPLPKRFAK